MENGSYLMNVFKRLFGITPKYDLTLGDSLATVIQKEARKETFETMLREVKPLRNGHWDERAFYVDLCGESMADLDCLIVLPDDGFGNLIRGAAGFQTALKARGDGLGSNVSEE